MYVTVAKRAEDGSKGQPEGRPPTEHSLPVTPADACTMAEASLGPSTVAPTVVTSTLTDVLSPAVKAILKAPLKKEELEFELQDVKFLADFEKAWARFLRKHPNCLNVPRKARMMDLEQTLEAAKLSKEKVEAEIEQQMAFFTTSCEQLEDEYAHKMQQAIDRQAAVQEELTKRIEVVNEADALQQETLPWYYFIHQLDTLTDQATLPKQLRDIVDDVSVTSNGLNVKPSRRALFLTDYESRHLKEDVLLRAHTIDNAILNAHIAMLGTEIKRYDKAVQAQELASKFLTDYNVWTILGAGGLRGEGTEATMNHDLAGPSPSGMTSLTDSHA